MYQDGKSLTVQAYLFEGHDRLVVHEEGEEAASQDARHVVVARESKVGIHATSLAFTLAAGDLESQHQQKNVPQRRNTDKKYMYMDVRNCGNIGRLPVGFSVRRTGETSAQRPSAPNMKCSRSARGAELRSPFAK